MATLFPERRQNGADGATSDEGTGDEDQADDHEDHDNLDSSPQSMNSTEVAKPKRILIFTSLALLSLLSLCRNGSVDGTFKSVSKHWKQLFIFLCQYKEAFLPVCFAWLPDKTTLSYHVMLLLLLITFKRR